MAKGTVNKVIILGRLGQDPEVRSTASGTQVVNLNVATTEVGRADQSGQRAEQTEWHRIVLFGKTAEIAAQYLSKGSQVYIEGRLQTRKWQDQNGQDRYSTEIVGNEMQFIGGRSDSQSQGSQPANAGYSNAPQSGRGQQPQAPQGNYSAPAKQQPAPAKQQPAPAQPTQSFDDFDDDIPF